MMDRMGDASEGRFGSWNATDRPAPLPAARLAAEEAVRAEVDKGTVELRPIGASNPTGFVETNVFALSTKDTSCTLPDILPLHNIAWPETLRSMWHSFRANAITGLFTSLSRAWVAADNKLLLWNYATGRDFTVFDEIPELIITVGDPIRPKSGVFQPHITYVLPIATPKAVYLVGLCVVGNNSVRTSELKVVNLGFAVLSPFLVARIVGSKATGRLFAAGSDGAVYEVCYSKASSPYNPQMRLVNYSIPFGSVPVLNVVGKMMTTIKQTWTSPNPALRDIAIDDERPVLYALDVSSTISLWTIESNGLHYHSSLKHNTTGVVHSSALPMSGQPEASPLIKLFCVAPNLDGFTLVAVAENGDQFRYAVREAQWPISSPELQLRDRVPSPFSSPNEEVGVCFVSNGTLVCSHSAVNDADAADTITVVNTSSRRLPPHQNTRGSVTSFDASASRLVRVDAIGEVPEANGAISSNEYFAQVFNPPKRFLLAHRHGIADYIQLRPVDTLHAILAVAETHNRESLLERFAASCSLEDYCCMLIQIASGGTSIDPTAQSGAANGGGAGNVAPFSLNPESVSHGWSARAGAPNQPPTPAATRRHDGGTLVGKAGELPPASASPSAYSSANAGAGRAEWLGGLVTTPPTSAVQRMCRELLRKAMTPSWQEAPLSTAAPGVPSARQIVVQMSPFACAVVAYIGRALFPLWHLTISDLPFDTVNTVEMLLNGLLRLLESCKNDIWVEQPLQPDIGIQWDKCRATVTLPTMNSYMNQSVGSAYSMGRGSAANGGSLGGISGYDLRLLQSSFIHAASAVANDTLQVFRFLKQTAHIPLTVDDAKLTLAQVLSTRENATGMARHVALTLLSSSSTRGSRNAGAFGGFGEQQNEQLRAFMWLQRECPYLFSAIDIQEYRARTELDNIASVAAEDEFGLQLSGLLNDFESNVSPSAAALWTSGGLKGICEQLVAMKKEGTAVQLLLRAARQIDPTNVSLSLYLSERSGTTRHHTMSQSALSVYHEKVNILDYVISIIERAWNTHRSVADSLLGGPLASGSIWTVETNDEMAHFYLFNWFCGPRDDAAVAAMLKETLVAANSPYVEEFLRRNISVLGEQYASFLRRTRKNSAGAIDVYLMMAQGTLSEVPREDRLAYRLRCLTEAVDCAAESRSSQLNQVTQKRDLATAQLHLARIVCSYLDSKDVQLNNAVVVEGRRVTERELAAEQLEMIDNYAMNERQLLECAGMFSRYGGAEVQLDVLKVANMTDPMLYAACIERAFQHRSSTPEEVARRILLAHRDTVQFPIVFVAKEIDARAFKRWPDGTDFTVNLFLDCHVDTSVVYAAYVELLDKKDCVGRPSKAYDEAGVTDAYLLYALAVALERMVFAPNHGSFHVTFLNSAISTAYNYVNRVTASAHDAYAHRAVEGAQQIVERCGVAAGRLGGSRRWVY